jgi:DNA mismatch repair protein MSH3
MLLNANTLSCLEIFRNETDYTEHGSLFWVLDHTRTQFGQRLLRKWVGKPLIDREEIELRSQAVTELKNKFDSKIDAISGLMKRLPDLEKGLINVHYKRVSILRRRVVV